MILEKKDRFVSFGALATWVVGVQYYDGREAAEDREVVFERDPDNPFDANAIGVYTVDGEQLGHLPRYDAEYMSPLIVEGAIALRGKTGVSERNDRVPLRLEVFATEKAQGVLDEDEANDWRAIYHNLFVQVWRQLDRYSAAALEAFRDRFREIAHKELLYPKTQFLYRMLKAHIEYRHLCEVEEWRDRLVAAVDAWTMRAPMGWNQMAVYPLFDNVTPDQTTPPINTGSKDIRKSTGHPLAILPKRCPYPPGATGALILVHNTFYALEHFEQPGECEVYWLVMCAGALEAARSPLTDNDAPDNDPPFEHGVEAMKERLREMLQGARCELSDTQEPGGLLRLQVEGPHWNGYTHWRDQRVVRVHVRGREEELPI